MKKYLLLAAFLIAVPVIAHAQGVEWHKSYKDALKLARESGKPILIDFWADWCKPCKAMEANFWPRADVAEVSRNFICVKADFDSERGLASKFGVASIPNLVITDPWGLFITRSRGYGSNPTDLLNKLSGVPTDYSSISDAVTRLDTNENDRDSLKSVADFYEGKNLYGAALVFRARQLKATTDAAERKQIALNLGLSYLRVGDPDNALDTLKDHIKEFPDEAKNEMVLFGFIYAFTQKGKQKDAQRYLDTLKAEHPDSQLIAKATEAVDSIKKK